MYFLMLNILRVLVGIYISSAIICTCTIKEPCEALWTKSDNNSTWIQTWIPLGNSVMTGLAPESICGPPSCNAFVTVRKRSCGKVKFSQACVKNSVHRRGGVHPPGRPPHLLSRHPPGTPPPTRDGHCSGRYSSYWNAFLFHKPLSQLFWTKKNMFAASCGRWTR